MIYLRLVAAAAIFLAGWMVNGWRYESQINDIKYEQSEAARKVFESAQRQHEIDIAKKDEAINEATKRAQQNQALARALDSDINRVRDDLNATRSRLSSASVSSVREYAIAADELFGSCQAEYAYMAGKAQGHAEDVRLMKESSK